jgi:type I restriction enzyme S subunit
VSDLGLLEKLLDGAGVEWLPLEKIAQIKHGKDWKNLGEGDVPVYGSGGVMGHVDTCSHDKPTVLIPRKGSITNVFYVDTPFWNVDTIFYTDIDVEQVVPRYLFHFVKTIDLMALDTGSGRPSLTQAILNRLLVPIPCPEDPEKSLAIQGEIVRILDTFTELTAELTAELAGRKKQYNHYRDQLYCFENTDVEWKILGDVCDFQNGFAFKSSLFLNEGLPIIRIKNVSGGSVNMDDVKYFDPTDYRENTDAFTVEKGDILVAMSGATTGKIGYYAHDFIAYLNQRVGKFLPNVDELNARYLYHFLLSQNQKIYSLAGGGAQPNLSSNALKAKINIPIPYPSDPVRSVAEQERIAIILDKLDTLTTSLSEGLPREIALRQQQYEYYRDLLLSFPKPAEAVEA